MHYSRIPVLKRLIPSFRKRRAWLSPPNKYRIVKREGSLFLANFAAWADRMVVIHGLVEHEQIEFLIRSIRERECTMFLDIGAHMGTYAITVAKRTQCTTIFAFEPDPRNYAHLQANLLLNGLVQIIQSRAIAISNSDGVVSFILGPATHDVWSRVGEGHADSITTTVPSARIDSILAVTGQSIALKVDIEGHELVALEGMQNLLRENRCIMQVECFDDNLPGFEAAIRHFGYHLVHAIGPDRYFMN
jgi:FkbM family methyltransferase